MIDITKEQARAVLTILVEECGHPRDGDAFVFHITRGCIEYRFCGALGFGGKFRNNGNNDDTPYVDCYPEHETPEPDEDDRGGQCQVGGAVRTTAMRRPKDHVPLVPDDDTIARRAPVGVRP